MQAMGPLVRALWQLFNRLRGDLMRKWEFVLLLRLDLGACQGLICLFVSILKLEALRVEACVLLFLVLLLPPRLIEACMFFLLLLILLRPVRVCFIFLLLMLDPVRV